MCKLSVGGKGYNGRNDNGFVPKGENKMLARGEDGWHSISSVIRACLTTNIFPCSLVLYPPYGHWFPFG